MPKPNKTMLDKLAETFKSMGKGKPEIIQETTIRDPLSWNLLNRKHATLDNKLPSMTPERQTYQNGLGALVDAKKKPILEKYDNASDELEDVQNEFEEAFDEAKEGLVEDIRSDMNYFEAPMIRYGFDAGWRGDLSPEFEERSLADYWPSRFKEPEWYNDRGYELDDLMNEYEERLNYMDEPEYRMELQRQTPRYRNYQRAMRQREDNARVGRLNAAIMNLARQGYSLPEIREILRNQRIR